MTFSEQGAEQAVQMLRDLGLKVARPHQLEQGWKGDFVGLLANLELKVVWYQVPPVTDSTTPQG